MRSPTPVRSLLLAASLAACGGPVEESTLPDERADLAPSSGGAIEHRVVDMPTGLDGTQWRWLEAHCTEGPLDLQARGFAQQLRVSSEGTALRLTYDQVFATEGCSQTVVQRVSPPETPGELVMEEIARVAVPSTPACFGRPEATRPGEVRRVGDLLEVLVQRSNWCNGFEVRMVYAPARPEVLADEAIVRRYVAHFSRGEVEQISQLFAPTASLLESFTRTETGDPYRHEGRAGVRSYFEQTFAGVAWRGMQIVSMVPGEQPHTLVVEWDYMDPRLAQPVRGRNRFTLAGGEIFESQIELVDAPVLAPAGG